MLQYLKMKKTTALLIMLFAFVFVNANPVDVATAKKIAENYFKSKNVETTSLELTCKAEQENEIYTYYYVFSAQPQGFIIISGEDNITPILGYSFENEFVTEGMPANIARWLDGYKRQIRYVIENNISTTDEVRGEWEKYSVQNIEIDNNRGVIVAPMIATKWDQGAPYNNFCPGSGNTKAVTGCTATAMAQVMKYWNHPVQGVGTHTYTPPYTDCPEPIQYPPQTVDFGNTTYDWDNMIDKYPNANSGTQEQRDAVATLMHHCGVSVNMIYSACGSGAWAISYNGYYEHCSENALPTYFNYKNTLSGKERDHYTENQWIDMLKTDLDAGRPVLYVGYYPDGAGHTFVCDGYNDDNLFHFNFGWSGYDDGYFTVASPDGFTDDQNALFGIEPESALRWEIGRDNPPDVIAILNNGDLKINGTGAMQDFPVGAQPWVDVIDDITKATINSGVTNIGKATFYDCCNLASVNISESVSEIGEKAFSYPSCDDDGGLTDVTVHWTTPLPVDDNVFAGVVLSNVNLHVPSKTECAYATTPVWQNFNIDGASFTVTPTAGNGGSISPNTVQTVNCGDEITFTAIPEDDQEVYQWKVNSIVVQTGENSYTLSDIQKNMTINVTFKSSVGINKIENNQPAIFPNPVKDILTIEFENANFVGEVVKIYDFQGKESMKCKLSDGKINVSALSAGSYILKIGDYAVKFVKE